MAGYSNKIYATCFLVLEKGDQYSNKLSHFRSYDIVPPPGGEVLQERLGGRRATRFPNPYSIFDLTKNLIPHL